MLYVHIFFLFFVFAQLSRSFVCWRFSHILKTKHRYDWAILEKYGFVHFFGMPIFDWPALNFLRKRQYKALVSNDAVEKIERFRLPIFASYFAAEIVALPIFIAILVVILVN